MDFSLPQKNDFPYVVNNCNLDYKSTNQFSTLVEAKKYINDNKEKQFCKRARIEKITSRIFAKPVMKEVNQKYVRGIFMGYAPI